MRCIHQAQTRRGGAASLEDANKAVLGQEKRCTPGKETETPFCPRGAMGLKPEQNQVCGWKTGEVEGWCVSRA